MQILAVTTSLTSLAAVAVVLRLTSRVWYMRTAGWDDLIMVLSLMADLVFYAFVVLELHYGLGKPEAELSKHQIEHQMKALWFSIPFYNMTLTLTKISMAILYRRLIPSRRYRLTLLLTIIFIIITGLWMILSAFFFCIPVSAFWNTDLSNAKCLPEKVVWCLNAALQIVTDLTIVIAPMPVLTRLILPKRQKFALVLVFGLGFFVCAMSIVRLTTLANLINSLDPTKSNGPTAVWSSIEANVAIICSCLPPLRPLVAGIFPRLFQPLVRSSSSRQREKKPCFYSIDLDSAFNPDASHYSASVTGQEFGAQHPDAEGIQVVRELRWDCSRSNTPSVEDNHSEPHPEKKSSSVLDP